jgi:hypothetical protein
VTETNPPRSATEELLISAATDRAAAGMHLHQPQGTSVFVDSSQFEGTDSKYAIGAIRDSLLKQGMRLAEDKKGAAMVAEIRSGALSLDQSSTLLGIPEFNIPLPFVASGFTFPEIALYKAEEQKGIAKFALTGYDARTGALEAASEPLYGFSHKIKRTLLIFLSWTENDAVPDENRGIMSRLDTIMPP